MDHTEWQLGNPHTSSLSIPNLYHRTGKHGFSFASEKLYKVYISCKNSAAFLPLISGKICDIQLKFCLHLCREKSNRDWKLALFSISHTSQICLGVTESSNSSKRQQRLEINVKYLLQNQLENKLLLILKSHRFRRTKRYHCCGKIIRFGLSRSLLI